MVVLVHDGWGSFPAAIRKHNPLVPQHFQLGIQQSSAMLVQATSQRGKAMTVSPHASEYGRPACSILF